MVSVRKITLYASIGLGVIAVVVGVYILHKLTGPVKAHIITAASVSNPPPAALVSVNGTYASFSYPGSLTPAQNAQGATGNELAVYSYTKPDVQTWHLNITINNLQQPTLTADSNYLLRINDPTRYQSNTETISGNTFAIMTDTQVGGFSEVAFTLHNGVSADISLTGDDSSGGTTLATVFQEVLNTWDWL